MYANSYCHRSRASLEYMEDSRQLQVLLHQLLTQASGFALLMFTRRAEPSLCAGPLDIADQRMKLAQERFRSLRPVREAAHHHHHLGEATRMIGHCLRIAYACLTSSADQRDRDDLTRMLRTALEHLRTTAKLLPGFEMVDLRQACCAAHIGSTTGEFVAEAV